MARIAHHVVGHPSGSVIFPSDFSGYASLKVRCRVGDEAVAQGGRGGLVHVSEDDFEDFPAGSGWSVAVLPVPDDEVFECQHMVAVQERRFESLVQLGSPYALIVQLHDPRVQHLHSLAMIADDDEVEVADGLHHHRVWVSIKPYTSNACHVISHTE